MRPTPHKAENFRIRRGGYASNATFGNNGAFIVPGPCGQDLSVIASDEGGWEHVSVSLPKRCPNWPEMCAIKNLFWSEEECVIQYHPPRSLYVSHHPYCLHLWKPLGADIPMPPTILVGPVDSANPTEEEKAAIRSWQR